MDYKELLEKYMKHVRDCEGTDFTDRLNVISSGTEVHFSSEEAIALINASSACTQ